MNRSLLFAALFLAGPAQAYVILESKYHVEVKPGMFEDQLVLKCDDGRQLTVPWEARLSEACGEIVIPKLTAAGTVQEDSREQKNPPVSRGREQQGNVAEQPVTIKAASGALRSAFSPQMREVLKRYEVCRKNTKGSPACAAERDQAIAALSAEPGASTPAAVGPGAPMETQPAAKSKAAAKAKPAAPKPLSKADPVTPEHADATVTTADTGKMRAATPPAAPGATPVALVPDRAAREQKIADDYTSCMRAKPKAECDTARATALKALDAPVKPKTNTKAAATSAGGPAVATN